MKKTSLFCLVIFSFHLCYSQRNLTETEKYATIIKLWGFLKYYHPGVTKGNFNWDEQLTKRFADVKNSNTKEEFNTVVANWINSLGEVKECKLCHKTANRVSFLKNFDLSWTDNQNIFNLQNIDKLNYIETNRSLNQDYYLQRLKGSLTYKNELNYGAEFKNNDIALIELARYWNFVEYFFPYKYMTDEKWDAVLAEMIPRFLNVKNTRDYHTAALEMVTKIDDSHGFFYSNEMYDVFGRKFLPINLKMAEKRLLVTEVYEIYDDREDKLYKNDVIIKINDKTPEEYLSSVSKYLPASNMPVKWNRALFFHLFSRTNDDYMNLQVLRKDQIIKLQLTTFLASDLPYLNTPLKNTMGKWRTLPNNIGYVNMGSLEKEEVEEMFADLKHTKSIIFDIRNHPKSTIYKISDLLFPEKYPTVHFMGPDLTYPGKFNLVEEQNHGKNDNANSYRGKILVLVNEVTQSHAEYTTMILQAFPRTQVIGSQTAGADGNVNKFNLLNQETWFTGLATFYPNGKETQRIGIVPDIEVKPTLKGLQEGIDEVLEKAIEVANL